MFFNEFPMTIYSRKLVMITPTNAIWMYHLSKCLYTRIIIMKRDESDKMRQDSHDRLRSFHIIRTFLFSQTHKQVKSMKLYQNQFRNIFMLNRWDLEILHFRWLSIGQFQKGFQCVVPIWIMLYFQPSKIARLGFERIRFPIFVLALATTRTKCW